MSSIDDEETEPSNGEESTTADSDADKLNKDQHQRKVICLLIRY